MGTSRLCTGSEHASATAANGQRVPHACVDEARDGADPWRPAGPVWGRARGLGECPVPRAPSRLTSTVTKGFRALRSSDFAFACESPNLVRATSMCYSQHQKKGLKTISSALDKAAELHPLYSCKSL